MQDTTDKLNYKNPIVFFNPKSAGGKTRRRFDEVKKALSNSRFNFENITFVETKKNRDDNNRSIKEQLEKKIFDLIITIGGDGTISSIVNGMFILDAQYHLPIMPIPFGSGNSVLREFGILTMKQVLDNYLKLDKPKDFDLLYVQNRQSGYKYYCINIIGMGFITDVALEVLKFNKKFGAFSYVIGVITALHRFVKYDTTVTLGDGRMLRFEKAQFLSVSNTQLSGGAIKIAPKAHYNDGLMDVCVLHDLSKFAFLRGFAKTFKGRHIFQKGCEYYQTNKISIQSQPQFKLMPDGEIEETGPIDIEVIKSAIKVVI